MSTLQEFIDAVSIFQLKPDDVIVIKTKRILEKRQFEEIREALLKNFGQRKCVILDGELDMEIVRDNTPPAAADPPIRKC